ncbi:MAG TPA: hypothetical protein EYP55_11755, partial [Anaerolineae bacterium]|nr:hypothetical protein [Anaerolineae bacterium]
MALPACPTLRNRAAPPAPQDWGERGAGTWHLLIGGALLLALGAALLSISPSGPPAVASPEEGIWTTYANGDDVQALAVEGDVVRAGTKAGGLVRWNAADGTYAQFLHPQDGLLCNDVRDVTIDDEGRVWLATCRGLSVLSAEGVISTTYTTANSGLPSDDVTAVDIDSAGTVWLGTNGGGVASF